MPTTIDLKTRNLIEVGTQRVYTTPRFGGGWVEQPRLHCLEATWCCAPTIPTATVVYDYGEIRYADKEEFETVPPIALPRGSQIKIVFQTHKSPAGAWQTKTWYGVVQMEVNDMLGATVDPAAAPPVHAIAGRQTLVAYGYEFHLQNNPIRRSFFLDKDAAVKSTPLRLGFNEHGKPNSTPAETYNTGGNDSAIFASDLDTAVAWSSARIAKYLIAQTTPRNSGDVAWVKYVIDPAAVIPNWDTPEIRQDDATTLGLLNRLIDRRRLLMFWFDFNEEESKVVLKTNTMTPNAVAIDIPGAASVPANTNQLALICDEDQLTNPRVIRDSDVQHYDVVYCYGAEEISVGSFSVMDDTLRTNWDSIEQLAYEQGGSTGTAYATANKAEKQRLNAEARSNPRVAKVFASFKIPATWDGRVSAGGSTFYAMFPKFTGGGQVWPYYYPETFILPSLPLWKGIDWTGTAVADGVAKPTITEEMEPLVFFQRSDSETWVRGEDIGAVRLERVKKDHNFEFSINVHVPPRSHAVEVRAHGQQQFTIAVGEFTKLPVDKVMGTYSYATGMILTLAISSGARVTGRYPATDPVAPDAIRVLEIEAGDHYYGYYVAPQTVLGVNKEGALQRSTGGWIPKPAGNDHVHQLTALATLAWNWYAVPHMVLNMETHQLRNDIGLGDMILTMGDTSVPGGANVTLNSPVTEIKFTWPRGTPQNTPSPKMSITTFAGELDPTTPEPVKSTRKIDLDHGINRDFNPQTIV